MAAAHGERAPERLVQHVRTQERAVEIDSQHRHFGAPPLIAPVGVDVQGSGHDMLGPARGFFLVFAPRILPCLPCLGQPFLDWRGVEWGLST
jgi:hypothetical protein